MELQKIDATAIQSAMALERTKMANTRTMLAYLRSAVALFVAGAGLLRFVSEIAWIYSIGIIFIIATPFVLFFGLWEYATMRKRLEKHEQVERDLLRYEDDEEI